MLSRIRAESPLSNLLGLAMAVAAALALATYADGSGWGAPAHAAPAEALDGDTYSLVTFSQAPGRVDAFVVDYALSAGDCIAAMERTPGAQCERESL